MCLLVEEATCKSMLLSLKASLKKHPLLGSDPGGIDDLRFRIGQFSTVSDFRLSVYPSPLEASNQATQT